MDCSRAENITSVKNELAKKFLSYKGGLFVRFSLQLFVLSFSYISFGLINLLWYSDVYWPVLFQVMGFDSSRGSEGILSNAATTFYCICLSYSLMINGFIWSDKHESDWLASCVGVLPQDWRVHGSNPVGTPADPVWWHWKHVLKLAKPVILLSSST